MMIAFCAYLMSPAHEEDIMGLLIILLLKNNDDACPIAAAKEASKFDCFNYCAYPAKQNGLHAI